MKLLLIEDHVEISKVIFEYFELKNHQMDYARDGRKGLTLARRSHYDAIILDIMLPGLDGLTVARQLRETGVDIPILMLTARDDKDDILKGFEAGADDYLVKPFDLGVLEARLKAIHKRKVGLLGVNSLTFEDLRLDLTTHMAVREAHKFKLNNAQFILLKTLMIKAPRIATRDEIIQQIWGEDEPDEDLLRNHIYRLRNLVDKPFKQAYIKTIPKVGYQLRSD